MPAALIDAPLATVVLEIAVIWPTITAGTNAFVRLVSAASDTLNAGSSASASVHELSVTSPALVILAVPSTLMVAWASPSTQPEFAPKMLEVTVCATAPNVLMTDVAVALDSTSILPPSSVPEMSIPVVADALPMNSGSDWLAVSVMLPGALMTFDPDWLRAKVLIAPKISIVGAVSETLPEPPMESDVVSLAAGFPPCAVQRVLM